MHVGCVWVCRGAGVLALLFRVNGAGWGQLGFWEFRSRLQLAGSSQILPASPPSARSSESHWAEGKHGLIIAFSLDVLYYMFHTLNSLASLLYSFGSFRTNIKGGKKKKANCPLPSTLPILSEWLTSSGTINVNQDGMTAERRHPQWALWCQSHGEATSCSPGLQWGQCETI